MLQSLQISLYLQKENQFFNLLIDKIFIHKFPGTPSVLRMTQTCIPGV